MERWRALLKVTLWGGLCLLTANSLFAQENVPSARQIKSKEPRPDPLTTFENIGLTFPIALTTEVLANLSGGSARRTIWESLLLVGMKVDFEKAAGIRGLSASVSGLYPQGSGLTSEAVHDFNTLSNIDAYDSLRLYEAWVEQELADGRFSIRFGQILADTEFFSSEYGALFVNSSFGAIPLVSKNLNPPIFPVAAPGLRLRVAPNQSFYAEAAVFSGDVGNPSINNKHNTRLVFRSRDGALVFFETGFKVNPKEEGLALPRPSDKVPDSNQTPPSRKPVTLSGTYKLGAFFDSGRFSDSGGGSPHHGDYSIYFVADQELWHPNTNDNRALAIFIRVGAAPADRNEVTFYSDTGLNFKGLLASRKEDILGLGFSYTQLSHDLVGKSGDHIASHYERVLELTYQAAFGDRVSVQPDLQVILNPGAVTPASTAVVGGIRLNVKF
jgi:porin